MNWRAFEALVRREVRRGLAGIRFMVGLAAAALVCALLLPFVPGVIAGGIAMFVAFFVPLAPLSNLREDKLLGHLEFDRVLPISHRAIALARLIGSGIRTAPMMLLVIPLFVALYRHGDFGFLSLVGLATLVPLSSWMLFTAFLWFLMAVNARWNLRKLWWLPMTIGFSPTIIRTMVPPAVKSAIKEAFTGFFDRNGEALVAFAVAPAGIISIAVVTIAIPVAMLYGAVTLFASGLERYTYDASAAVDRQSKPPTRELAAIGKGPSLAVARFCIRLAMEQSKQRLIVLAILIALLLFGSHELKSYAQVYVRALAALIPGGIAMHLSMARSRGDLEGISQLPHPAISIGAGYLLGVAVLATPGAAVWVLARAVNGIATTFGNSLSLWAWMVGWSWVACALMVWLTSRRMAMLVATVAAVLLAWAGVVGIANFPEHLSAAGTAFSEFRAHAGVALPLVVAVAMMVGGLPLFARGLDEYEFNGAKGPGLLARWQEQARARRR